MSRATVHTGPKGGVEYRLWTGANTFRVVGRYEAWPHMDEAERATADRMVLERSRARRAKAEQDAAWRHLMRGG